MVKLLDLRITAGGTAALLIILAGCGGSSSSGSEPSASGGWEEVPRIACSPSAPATDADEATREDLTPEEREFFDDIESNLPDDPSLLEDLSCDGDAPFLRNFDSATAREIWTNERLLSDGSCEGSAVVGETWVVSTIRDSATAAALVEHGGELLDC